MYKTPKFRKTLINTRETVEGESIETKMERLLENNEPLTEKGTQLIYTERKEGVKAGYNIRTDRFEVALDAMDIVHKTEIARRTERQKERDAKIINLDAGSESTQGTSEQ